MIKFLNLYFSLFLILSCYSCYKSEPLAQEEQAIDTVQSKPNMRSNGLSEEDYLLLSDNDKRNFWIERLQHLNNNQNINPAQATLLQQTIIELQNMSSFVMTSELVDLGNQIVNEFSETDFLVIFTTVDDYTFSATNIPTCTHCTVDIGGSALSNNLPDCNCRWTCGGPESGSGSCVNSPGQQNCCNEVMGFCGFLGLQRCTGRDTLF